MRPTSAASASALLVTQVFPPAVGGSGALLENIYARMGSVDVTVLTDSATCPGSEVQRGRLRIRRVALDGAHWGVLSRRAILQHSRVARTIRALAREAVVVHCGRAQPEGAAALLASRWPSGPPFLFWAHGEEITTAQTSRDFSWVMRRVYRGAAAAIANSRNTARLLERAGFPGDRIRIIYPGVDCQRFHPHEDSSTIRQHFAPNGELLLLTVGRLQRRKGHDVTLAALGKLRDRLSPFRYVIVGNGSERPYLERLALEHGVRDRVVFVGEVPAEDLPGYFAACDLFVHPNRVVDGYDFEGFGLVFLEAAAAGKPVIGGASGGVPEAVIHEGTGLLVNGTDVEELAAAIERLSASVELRLRLGMAGRARVERQFTWNAAAEAVEQIHLEVATSWCASRGRSSANARCHSSTRASRHNALW